MKEKIRIVNLYKSFGEKHVIRGVDLSIMDGEIFCIIGKSGSGKSVILKHLIGLLHPDSGAIYVDNNEFTSADENSRTEIRSKFGVLFQGAALFDSMTIYDNVAFGIRRKGLPEDEISRIVPDMLQRVGLRGIEDKMPSELSGGMQKRVGLARSIAMEPEIMLYDEPTTGVDPITAGAVDRLILSMRDTLRITSIVVTHDVESVNRIADRVAMILEGKIVFIGTPCEIQQCMDPRVRQFIEGRADGPIKVA